MAEHYVTTTLPSGATITQLVADPIAVAPSPVWVVTKLAFKNRFPRAKWMAAKAAVSPGNQFDDFFESFNLARYIVLTLSETIASVTSFSHPSLPDGIRLTQEEVDSVLNVPAAEGEIPLEALP